jgi:hypothetical protein
MTHHDLQVLRAQVARSAKRNRHERSADSAAELTNAKLDLLKARREFINAELDARTLEVLAA